MTYPNNLSASMVVRSATYAGLLVAFGLLAFGLESFEHLLVSWGATGFTVKLVHVVGQILLVLDLAVLVARASNDAWKHLRRVLGL
jgi:hypothetical protein